MKAIIARSILLATVTAMIPVSAHAIEIKTPTVAVPHVNVPQVKTPQTTVHGKTLEMNTHITAGGNGGKTIEGQGNSRYQGTDKTVPLIGRGGEHPPSTATSSTPSGGQTTTVGLAHAATVG